MNLKEWAEKLNGCEYGNEISDENKKALSEDGVVVVYGYSDDLMELDGAIYDEYEAYDEETYYWFGKSFVSNDKINEFLNYIDDDFYAFKPLIEPLFKKNFERSYITSKPGKDCQFEYQTNIPNVEWFDVMEDGELYCKGFVFYKNDLKEKNNK